jgi:hypothetical protein
MLSNGERSIIPRLLRRVSEDWVMNRLASADMQAVRFVLSLSKVHVDVTFRTIILLNTFPFSLSLHRIYSWHQHQHCATPAVVRSNLGGLPAYPTTRLVLVRGNRLSWLRCWRYNYISSKIHRNVRLISFFDTSGQSCHWTQYGYHQTPNNVLSFHGTPT